MVGNIWIKRVAIKKEHVISFFLILLLFSSFTPASLAYSNINANDWNGNYETALVYHRPSIYGAMAAKLGSDTIYGNEIAGDLGILSGLSATVAEIPELVILIGDDPSGFLAGIKDLAGSIASDPALLADLVSSLPDSVKEKQKLENPYAVGTTLNARFAEGWYSGYIGTQIVSIFVGGGEVLQTVKSSERFAQAY